MRAEHRLRRDYRGEVPMNGVVAVKSMRAGFKSSKKDSRTYWGWATTTAPDENGEVVLPEGIDTGFFPDANKTVLLDHDKSVGVGVCRNYRLARKGSARGMEVQTFISETQLGQDVLTMIKEGVLGALSIGYVSNSEGPPNAEERKEFGPNARLVLRSIRLIEYSLVFVPMNVDARIEKSKSLTKKGVSRETIELAGWRIPTGRTTAMLDVELPGPSRLDVDVEVDRAVLPI